MPTISDVQFIQYQLDNSATIHDVIDNTTKVRIFSFASQLHFFFCDSSNACGILQFVEGRPMMVVKEPGNPLALTNDFYGTSLDALKKYETTNNLPAKDSLKRFVIAHQLMKNFPGSDEMTYAWSAAKALTQEFPKTLWSFVTNNQYPGRIYFRDARELNKQPQWIDLNKMKPKCSAAEVMLPLNSQGEGDQSQNFIPFNLNAQEYLVAQWDEIFPSYGRWLMRHYPRLFTYCLAKD
jgi:hypothetical protein